MCPKCKARTFIKKNNKNDRECSSCGHTCMGHSYVQKDICKKCVKPIELLFKADTEYAGGYSWVHVDTGQEFCAQPARATPGGEY